MNYDDSLKSVQQFCEDRNWDQFHAPKELAIGLVTEASELLEIFRFKSDQEQRELLRDKREKIGHELADVYFMLLRFGQLYQFDLNQALADKMKENNQKYPVEKSINSNKKYSEL